MRFNKTKGKNLAKKYKKLAEYKQNNPNLAKSTQDLFKILSKSQGSRIF